MRRFFGLASTASPRGRRKLRAYPGFTRTTSPILPRLGTSSRRITCTGMGRSSRIGGGVGQQRHGAGALDRDRELALVAGAGSPDAAGGDLAPVGEGVPDRAGILVVDRHRPGGAEATDLAPP